MRSTTIQIVRRTRFSADVMIDGELVGFIENHVAHGGCIASHQATPISGKKSSCTMSRIGALADLLRSVDAEKRL